MKNILKKIQQSALVFSFIFLSYTFAYSRVVETNYGPINVSEQIILDLIDHSAMQRLKSIHQYGVGYYIINDYDYNRFEHSLGVFALLRRFGAPLDEQIAGLLHDVSHTIFSHVGDHFFNHRIDVDSYQDDIHDWFLNESGISKILEFHGYTVEQVIHKNKKFRCLEQNLPDICADRLEYVLYGGFLEKTLTKKDVSGILTNLCFEDGKWYFITKNAAKKFARTSLYLTEKLFASDDSLVAYELMAKMLHYAVDKKLISLSDINFGYDDEIWHKLKLSENKKMQNFFSQLYSLENSYIVTDEFDKDSKFYRCKFRGIDPWIKIEDGFKRLTEVDKKFNKEFYNLKEKVYRGWYLRFL